MTLQLLDCRIPVLLLEASSALGWLRAMLSVHHTSDITALIAEVAQRTSISTQLREHTKLHTRTRHTGIQTAKSRRITALLTMNSSIELKHTQMTAEIITAIYITKQLQQIL